MHLARAQSRAPSPVLSDSTSRSRSLPFKMFGRRAQHLTDRTTQSSITLCDGTPSRPALEPAISFKTELAGSMKLDGSMTSDSYSINYTCTDQEPYSSGKKRSTVQQNRPALRGGDERESYTDLAMFLQTTGPLPPHRRPSKILKSGGSTKGALNFLRHGSKRTQQPSKVQPYTETNGVLYDEGCLLQPVPEKCEQRFTSTGKRYLALKVHDPRSSNRSRTSDRYKKPRTSIERPVRTPNRSPRTPTSDYRDSRISFYLPEDIPNNDGLHTWFHDFPMNQRHSPVSPLSEKAASVKAGAEEDPGLFTKSFLDSPSPVRPAASNPPSPQPESAGSMAEAYQIGLADHPAHRITLLSQRTASVRKPLTPIPNLSLPKEEFPVRIPGLSNEVEIKHPSPRRLYSHPLLLKRSSSFVDPLLSRSAAGTPATPPPKSPLRSQDNRSREGLADIGKQDDQTMPRADHKSHGEMVKHQIIVPTVTTECIGPLTKVTQERAPVRHMLYPMSRKEREEKTRARKLRDRPYVARTIDAVVCAPPPLAPHRRLRKTRQQLRLSQEDDMRPAPLATRFSAMSNAVKTSLDEQSPPRPSLDSLGNALHDKTGYTPNSPAGTIDSASKISPVTLVAEQIPIPKTPPKPARLVLSKEKVYTPRPRSASMPRMSVKRRSRASVISSSRAVTPEMLKDEAPPLPSPPPNRALPPTPPASGSERFRKKSVKSPSKDLPIPPTYEILAQQAILGKTRQHPHVATQDSRLRSPRAGSDIHARLEALEKRNRMLEAALYAVLATNGASNTPLVSLADPDSPKGSMQWESRVTRRSEASHAASSSNGSALEMYMSTRRGSKTGS